MEPKSPKIAKKTQKKRRPKTEWFRTPFFSVFPSIWAPKTVQILYIFRCVFENVDFAKSSVSPRREQHFLGSRHSKNIKKTIQKRIKKQHRKKHLQNQNFHQFYPPKATPNWPQNTKKRKISLSEKMLKKNNFCAGLPTRPHPARQAQKDLVKSSIHQYI